MSSRQRSAARAVNVPEISASWSRSSRARADHLGHLDAERSEHVGHLGGNEAAAEHQHRRRQRLQPHDRVGGVDARPECESGDVGHDRPAAGGEHDLLAGDGGRGAVVQGDVERLVTGELGPPLVHGDVGGARSLAVGAARRGDAGRCARRCGRGCPASAPARGSGRPRARRPPRRPRPGRRGTRTSWSGCSRRSGRCRRTCRLRRWRCRGDPCPAPGSSCPSRCR